MKTNPTPGARFRTFRAQLDLSGQALGERLGVSKTAISYWESGRVALSHAACLLAERLYHVSSKWLLDGEGPMWLPAEASLGLESDGLVHRPLLAKEGAFQPDGQVVRPRDTAPCIGLPPDIIDSILASCGGGTQDDLFLVGVEGNEMASTLLEGDWAIVHTGLSARERVVDHSLYLVRLRPQDLPSIRRVAVDPISGDLLLGVEAKGQVPFRVTVSVEDLPKVLLGKVGWVGGRR